MKRGRTLRRLLAAVCFCALFCALFAGATQLLRNKDSAGAVRALYEEPRDSLDVVFVGSSHILNGAFPLELWHEYGIVSNNLGQHGQSIPISYYMVQEAIRTQHPGCIVLDAYMLYYPDLIYEGDGNSHKSIDNMAWAGPKLRAIFDLFPWEDRWDYLVPLSFYHGRWKELDPEDLAPIDTTGKGCEVRLDTQAYGPLEPVDPDRLPLPGGGGGAHPGVRPLPRHRGAAGPDERGGRGGRGLRPDLLELSRPAGRDGL